MTMNADAIRQIQLGEATAQANNAIASAIDRDAGVVAIPADMKVHDVQHLMPWARRMSGQMITEDLGSFVDYVRKYAVADASMVFIDKDDIQAKCIFDLGTVEQPGHAAHSALWDAPISEEHKAWNEITSGRQAQRDVAEFLEDYQTQITCVSPDGSLMSTLQVASAIRSITIEALAKRESTQEQLSASRSDFESIKASASSPLPAMITFTCEPYGPELGDYTFQARLRIEAGSKDPVILLSQVRLDAMKVEMARRCENKVRDVFTDADIAGVPVVVGKRLGR